MELRNLIHLSTSDQETVVFHVPPRDLAEDGETCQTFARGKQVAKGVFLVQGVQAGMR